MKRLFKILSIAVVIATALSAALPASGEPYRIGVYYWPGWKTSPGKPPPWNKIRPYPEREPLLGWYDEGSQNIMDRQLAWLKQYGLSYIVFSHLHEASGRAEATHAVEAYLRSPERQGLPFAVQWANHTPLPRSDQEFYQTIDFLIDTYFKRPEYLRIDGKPVFFVWSGVWIEFNARKFKGNVSAMIARANEIARGKGLDGIYFVAGEAVPDLWVKRMHDQGYNAISAYNYQNAPESAGRHYSHSYEELDAGYRENWQRIAAAAEIPYIVPMTVGWDRRPWGGSVNDKLHDLSSSTSEGFATHLNAARTFMDTHPALTHGMGIVCCWNEYGEGSYIEPTKASGFDRLETIKRVFDLKPR